MKKHWLRNLLALLVIAALPAPMVAVAEGLAMGEEVLEFDERNGLLPGEDLTEEAAEIDLSGLAAVEAPTEPKSAPGKGRGRTVATGDGSALSLYALANGGSLSVSGDSLTMQKGDEAELTVTFNYTRAGSVVAFNVSDTSVVTCRWADAWDGNTISLFVQAAGVGSATIRLTNTENDDTAEISVTVEEKRDMIAVSSDSVTVEAGQTTSVTVTYLGSGSLVFESSDGSIVGCRWADEWQGRDIVLYIEGLRAGEATVRLTNTETSDTAEISVTVEEKRDMIAVSSDSVSLKAGETTSVTVTYLGSGGMVFKAGDGSVVGCRWADEWQGCDIVLYIEGLRKGSETIEISDTASDAVVNVTATVASGFTYSGRNRKDGKQTCRALLIGQYKFDPPTPHMRGDVVLMARMLNKVKGPKGSSWKITKKYNLNKQRALKSIYSAFKNADKDDLSLFFISTHGDMESSGRNAGALAMLPSGFLFMDELASALEEVPGKVIVIVQSCGSGAGVYANGGSGGLERAAEAFDAAIVEAFAAADSEAGTVGASGVTVWGQAAANTGELRVKNKFYVLTSCQYHEYSWGHIDTESYCYFPKWLTDGIGLKGRMPADKNRNGVVTLNELYQYIAKVGNDHKFTSDDGTVNYQHVQMYPEGSSFKLFKRK